MKKRIRKQLSILLIVAMVLSMTCNVYADEVKDRPGVSENEPVMPGAGAAIEVPVVTHPEEAVSDDTASKDTTPSGDETVPAGPEEDQDVPPVPDDEEVLPVSGEEILPVEEEGDTVIEEPAGNDAADWLSAQIKKTSSGIITLSEDVVLARCLEIGGRKNITIDLNGHNITGIGSKIPELFDSINYDGNVSHRLVNKFLISISGNGTKVTLKDSRKTGSVSYDAANSSNSDSVVAVWGGAALTAEDITFTALGGKVAGEGSTSAMTTGAKGILVVGNTSVVTDAAGYYGRPKIESAVTLNDGVKITDSYIGIYALGSGASVTVNDGVFVAGKNTAIQNQGQISYFGTDITVNGGTLAGGKADSDAIYHAGAGNLTINGGTFMGATAVEISNGIANIRGGKTSISASEAFDPDLISGQGYLYSGSTTAGCAVCYSPYANYPGVKSELNISGGDFLGDKGLYIKKRDNVPDANLLNDVKLSVTGGSFTGFSADSAITGDVFSAGIFEDVLTGGVFNSEPDAKYIPDGYAAVENSGVYEVVKKIEAYIQPVLPLGYVFKGQSLKQSGLSTLLVDKYGDEIEGATVTGVKYLSTNKAGSSSREIDITQSCNEAGTYYIAAQTDTGFKISMNGADRTGYYLILNAAVITEPQILKYTVEEIKDRDSLSVEQKKEVFYSDRIENVYDYFALYFIHDGTKTELKKSSGAAFYWNGGNTPSDSFDCSGFNAGTEISLRVDCLEKTVETGFTIQRRPVYIKGAKAVNSLVGEELTERYYGLINVYGVDKNGKIEKDPIVSGDSVPIDKWFDASSSVIDLSGISNTRKYSGYKAVLKDLGKLKSDPKDDKETNYELMEKPWVDYNVDPSLILEFKEPSQESEIAPAKIRRSDDKTSLTIYSFTNKQSTDKAKWCVKTVRFDTVEQCWKEEMEDAELTGIKSEPVNYNKGTKFSFSDEFIKRIKDEGARYTLYEIFADEVTASDNNASLTVKAVSPVVYNGNKFVASDDSRYFSRGIAKNGFSPVLNITVMDGPQNRLVFGTDYTLSYKNNKNAGNRDSDNRPTVTVTGKGLYSGMKITVYFTILPANLAYAADVAMTTQYIKYNGKVLKPKPRVTFRSGVNAGKEIPASAYDITIFDETGKDVTSKQFKKYDGFARYRVVLTANESNPNISGCIDQTVVSTDRDGNEIKSDIFFYGIPKTSGKMTVGGTYTKVVYPIADPSEGIENFLDPDRFYAKTTEKKYFYQDVKNGSISVDLVDGKDECTATVYDIDEISKGGLDSGIYFLKVQFADDSLKIKNYVFEPVYVKVTYAGTKLKSDDIKLRKKNFDFSSEDENTSLSLKISDRVYDKGTDGIKLYIFQNGNELSLSDLAEEGYEIKGDSLSNNRPGKYRIRVEGTGSYYGAYDLTYTIGVQAYNKDTTPVVVLVNESDGAEQPVPYRPDGKYDDSMVKVVWTKSNGDTELLTQSVSGNEGDYYLSWGTFKQVGPNKGSVTVVGTGTRFTGKIKKKFDVTQAE